MSLVPNSRMSVNVRRILTAAVIAAVGASLPACESALSSDNGPDNSGRYADSMLAHAIREGLYAGPAIQTSTFYGGVRELPRVDEPGPGGAATTMASSATQPAGSQPTANIGLAAATLNMPEPVFNLSLQDAIARAVAHSTAIKVEAYDPAIKESLIIQAEAAFDPVLFGSSQWTNTDDPTSTAGNINGQAWQNQLGLRRLLPSGATVSAAANINYRDATSGNLTLIPPLNSLSTSTISSTIEHQSNYSSSIALSITQPLLRGFGADVNEANIYLAQRDLRISLATFRKQVMTSVADVETAYHNLVAARTTVDILERVLKASEQTYYMIQQRPDAAQASIYQALSAVTTRRADLYRSRSDYRVASDKLKALLNDPEIDIRGNILINPIDKPITEPIYYNVAECIETALNQRPEIQAARLLVEKEDIAVKVAKNDLLPKLDLTAGVQSNGQGDALPTFQGTPLPAPPRSLDKAFSSIVDPMNSIDWSAGIKLEFPLGNRFAEAQLVQRKNERNQAIETMIQNALAAVNEVKLALRDVLSYYGEIQLRDAVRQAAAGYLEGLINIEEIRPRTPEFLQLELDSQASLATAEQNEIQTIVHYNIAVMQLEQAKGTLLEFNRISLNRPPAKPADDDFGKRYFLGKSVLPP